MLIEWDEREEGMPAPDNVVKDVLAIEADVEDHWNIQDIMFSGRIGVRSSLCSDSSGVQKNCWLYGLDLLFKAGGLSYCSLGG